MNALLRKYNEDQLIDDSVESDEIQVDTVLTKYAEVVGIKRRNQLAINTSMRHWSAFIAKQKREGDIKGTLYVNQIKPAFLRAFYDWRLSRHHYDYIDKKGNKKTYHSDGAAGATVETDGKYFKAAINFGADEGYYNVVPRMPSLDERHKSLPRSYVLTLHELASLLEAATETYDRHPQALHYLNILAMTGGRPEAIRELHSTWAFNADTNLLQMNRPGRRQTRKVRPIIPMSRQLKNWLEPMKGYYIANSNVVGEYGQVSADRPKTSIQNAFIRAGLYEEVSMASNPGKMRKKPRGSAITLRHTFASLMMARGADAYELDVFTGHKPKTTTENHYVHLQPGYLKNPMKCAEELLYELSMLTKAHIDHPESNKIIYYTPKRSQNVAKIQKSPAVSGEASFVSLCN
jgi:integrase